MARRYDHSQDEIRAMAIDAGSKMVEQGGLASLSARGVAKAIGYTVGTIHNLFGSYDMLVLHINAKTLDELHIAIQSTAQKAEAGDICIRAMAHAYFRFAQNTSNRWRAIFEHSLPIDAAIPEWYAEKTARLFDSIEHPMQMLSPQKNAKKSATALWAGVHGICILTLSGKLNISSTDTALMIIENMLDNFIAGYVQDHTQL